MSALQVLPLPAHRGVETRAKDSETRVWAFDFDGTITGAPEFMARVACGLKALGDTVVVITGNKSPRTDLTSALADFGFPFDELIQYHDAGTDGIARAEYLRRLDVFGAFDNRVDRAFVLSDVCPTVFYVGPLTDADKDAAKKNDVKKVAKKAVKALAAG